MSEFIYTKENPLRVFTSFSGYDSQCMALDRIGIPYELVGWSEIDKYAIQAHNALYPAAADKNYGDISKINWESVPTLICSHTLSLVLIFQMPECKKDWRKAQEQDLLFCGSAARQLK